MKKTLVLEKNLLFSLLGRIVGEAVTPSRSSFVKILLQTENLGFLKVPSQSYFCLKESKTFSQIPLIVLSII